MAWSVADDCMQSYICAKVVVSLVFSLKILEGIRTWYPQYTKFKSNSQFVSAYLYCV